ncbi:MAG: hypothetical protein FRX49_00896 [Trebouxia sp. A1-2]|nr:MAG: hypothetical protein FRX49_00896 [Trebouxia sp. A1-2]
MWLARALKNNLKGKASGFNLLLTSHEDEDVPFRMAQVDGNGLLHSSLHIVLLGGLAEQGLHWEGAAWDLEDWHAAKEVGELAGVQSCRGDDQPEVPSLSHHLMHKPEVDEATYLVVHISQAACPNANVNADGLMPQTCSKETHLFQDPKQHIGVQRPFMGFIHDDSAVPIQVPLPQGLPQQHTISHVLDDGLGASDVLKPNGIPYFFPDEAAELQSNATGSAESGGVVQVTELITDMHHLNRGPGLPTSRMRTTPELIGTLALCQRHVAAVPPLHLLLHLRLLLGKDSLIAQEGVVGLIHLGSPFFLIVPFPV